MGGTFNEDEAVLARLDAAFAEQRTALSPRQLTVVRAWQRTAREYELAQAVARSEIDPDNLTALAAAAALEFQQDLDDAVRSARLPFALTVYRGIRSLYRTFGVDDPHDVVGREERLGGYVAASVLRRVAIEEFTAPAGALLEMVVPAGTWALWVAGAGAWGLRCQGELLLTDQLRICVSGCRWEDGLPVLSVEVISG